MEVNEPRRGGASGIDVFLTRSTSTMSFFVDIVTEDAFYENLTLGVVRILENSPCVRNVKVERKNACERSALSTWEQRHCCLLPEDLKSFYASIDGFLLTWSLDISGEEFPVGRMSIGEFASLKRFVVTKEELNQTEVETKTPEVSSQVPSLGPRSKLFELDQCGEGGRVFLTYQVRPELDTEPAIWLYREDDNGTDSWHHLADSFTKYFRMMLVHLGLPLWQYCAVGSSLPTWIEQVYYLVGPHLLPATPKPSTSLSTSLWKDGPPNTIDPAIFKGRENKQRNSRKK